MYSLLKDTIVNLIRLLSVVFACACALVDPLTNTFLDHSFGPYVSYVMY
jgi:hypothetical protein